MRHASSELNPESSIPNPPIEQSASLSAIALSSEGGSKIEQSLIPDRMPPSIYDLRFTIYKQAELPPAETRPHKAETGERPGFMRCLQCSVKCQYLLGGFQWRITTTTIRMF